MGFVFYFTALFALLLGGHYLLLVLPFPEEFARSIPEPAGVAEREQLEGFTRKLRFWRALNRFFLLLLVGLVCVWAMPGLLMASSIYIRRLLLMLLSFMFLSTLGEIQLYRIKILRLGPSQSGILWSEPKVDAEWSGATIGSIIAGLA